MTRRLDPIDRIRELSNASVPFKYDIHAMMYSEDAPLLEATLHNAFRDNKINMVNGRKEFFHVSIDEIEQKILEAGIKVDFVKIPEARDFRETNSIRNRLINRTMDDIIKEDINKKFPTILYNYDIVENEEEI